VKAEEVELIVNNFQLLYDYFVKHGRISEELYDQIGLQEDYNSSGDIKLRRSNADCHQRAMCLSAPAIHCRLFSVAKVPKSALWKEMKFKNVNKSTAILANTGEDNLISRAKAVSDRPVLLIASSVDVVGDDDDDDIETPSIMNNVFVPTIICEGDDSVESLVFSMGN